MNKLKALVVPKGIGRWLDHQELGKESTIFTVINNLDQLFRINLDNRTGYFIMLNKKELIEVIIGSRDYKVEDEQKYYVMNKENELILGWSQSAYMTPCIEGYGYMKHNGRENLFQLTEQEIKNYDERYWAFAVEVEEVEKCYLF